MKLIFMVWMVGVVILVSFDAGITAVCPENEQVGFFRAMLWPIAAVAIMSGWESKEEFKCNQGVMV